MYLKGKFIKFIKFIYFSHSLFDMLAFVATMSKFQIWVGRRHSWGSKGDLQAFLDGNGVESHIVDIGFDTGILIANT